jgi:hypothetical protein
MSRGARGIAAVGLFLSGLGIGCPTRAAEETPAQAVEVLRQMPKAVEDMEMATPELLPAPQELQPNGVMWGEPYLFHLPTRTNRYEVWQLYQVGRFGQFRPRVIYSAYGSYYLYDGRPFYGISTHQLDFMPVLISP